jgi:hypothetical protein
MKIFRVAAVIVGVAVLASCAGSSSGVGVGGLIDLRSFESLSIEIELEKPKWNSPPLLEILKDDEVIGYYTRSSKAGKLIEMATVHGPDRNRIFTIHSSLDKEGRNLMILDENNKEGRISAPYSPSAAAPAEVDLFDWGYSMGSGYARKAGADGYRHRQWMIADSSGLAMVIETKIWKDDFRETLMATVELASRQDELLLFSTVAVVFRELDAIDREREAQERAMGQVTDQAMKDSGFKFDVF